MSIRVLTDKILIKSEKLGPRQSSGGIQLLESSQEGLHVQGVVQKVGPDVKDVKVGDKVFFNKFTGMRIEVPTTKEELFIVVEKDIVAIEDIDVKVNLTPILEEIKKQAKNYYGKNEEDVKDLNEILQTSEVLDNSEIQQVKSSIKNILTEVDKITEELENLKTN